MSNLAGKGNSQPPASKRDRKEMEPDSPVGSVSLRSLFSEYLGPIKDEMESLKDHVNQVNEKVQSLTQIKEDMHVLTTQLADMKTSIEGLKAENAQLYTRMSAAETEAKQLKKQNESLSKQVQSLKNDSQHQDLATKILTKDSKKLEEKVLHDECQSRRDNLQFIGVPESRNENYEWTVLQICQQAGLDLNPRAIVRAHRLGGYIKTRTRPIIVKFHHYKDREMVFYSRKGIKGSQGIMVTEDFPREIQERRKTLLPISDAAFHYRDPGNPQFRNKVSLVVDRLYINGDVYTIDTLFKLPPHLQPEKISTPSSDDTVVFFTKASPLSNHYPCKFMVQNQMYTSVEQYLMQSKALYFKDKETADKIMRTNDPVRQKGLGKAVKGFDLKSWRDEAPAVLLKALREKFSQDQYCKAFLKLTDPKSIGEANPNDDFFGVGMSLRDPNVWDHSKWGNNLLGKCLMEVRAEL